MAEIFTPSILAVFDAGLEDCAFDALASFLVSVMDGTNINPRRMSRQRVERGIAEYSEIHVRPGEPEGFVSEDFARLYCDLPFEDRTHASYEELMPYIAALETEYGHRLAKTLFPAEHPTQLALVFVLPKNDADVGAELAKLVLQTFQPQMPTTHFHFVYVHKDDGDDELLGVRRAFKLICQATASSPDCPFDADALFFCVLNRPAPLHENALYLLKRESMRAAVRGGGVGCVAFMDDCDTCMSLAPVPTSRMSIKGANLRAFFKSSFFEQARRLSLKMWDSAVSQFVTFYTPPKEADMLIPKCLSAVKWPYEGAGESMTFGVDASKAYVEMLVARDRVPEIDQLISDFELDETVKMDLTPEIPNKHYGRYDRTVPIDEKPRTIPRWSPLEVTASINRETRLLYFTILYEATKLNVLASFGPAKEKLKSPASILAAVVPPQQLALMALQIVCKAQKWGLGVCIQALGYKNTTEHKERYDGHDANGRPPSAGAEAPLGRVPESKPGVLHQRDPEAGVQSVGPRERGCSGGGDAGGGQKNKDECEKHSETPV